MKFGYFALLEVPEWATDQTVLRDTMEVFVECERQGFDSVHVAEHHAGRYVCGAPHLLLGHVAARTERVRIGTAVSVLPLTHPVATAEQYAALDVLSDGRLEFGIGRGYQPLEFSVFGHDLDASREMMEEALEIVLRAWSGEPFAFEGRHYSLPEIEVYPQPAQRPHPPLLVASAGGYKPDAHDTFAWGAEHNTRIAVGGFRSNEEVRSDRGAQRDVALAAGHDEEDVDEAVSMSPVVKHVYVAESEEEAIADVQQGIVWFYEFMANRRMFGAPVEPKPFSYYMESPALMIGTPETVREQLDTFRTESGCEYVWIRMDAGGLEREKVVRSLRLFGEEVAPSLSEPVTAASDVQH